MVLKTFTQDVAFNDSMAISTANRRPEHVIQNGNLSKIQIAKAAYNRVIFELVVIEYGYILIKYNATSSKKDLYLPLDHTSRCTRSDYKIDKNSKGRLIYLAGTGHAAGQLHLVPKSDGL